ncbi:MAG: hypothetical protein MJ096_01510 [Clostridia bacterium]|nr:hypothetical protein [Clostridia bacterium]
MKKTLALILTALLAVSLTLAVSAGAYNPAGGCKTAVNVCKADPAAVVKDGIIGEGEYREIEVNRDPDATDLMLSYLNAAQYTQAEDFLQNVHFYTSWDEIHGLNFAIVSTLLEDPWCETPLPAPNAGDGFLFQFGSMYRVCASEENKSLVNRGIGINTTTGEILIGDYDENGYTGSLDLQAGRDYTVAVNGRTVTYEFSYPLASVVKAENIVDGAPTEGYTVWIDLTATGGSVGREQENGAITYAISLGDSGYMATWNQFTEPSHAKAVFTNDPVVEAAPDTTTDADIDQPSSGGDSETPGTEDTTGPVDTDNGQSETTETKGTEPVAPKENNVPTDTTSSETAKESGKAPATADPIVTAALVSGVSALGFTFCKKRK